MRFVLPTRVEPPGAHAFMSSNPSAIAEYIKQGFKVRIPVRHYPNLKGDDGLPLTIRSVCDTKSSVLARELMKRPGTLVFNPQDAIDEGLLSCEEVIALGYPNVQPREVAAAPPAPAPEVKESLPDFDTMTVDRLVKWADAQDPPIHLDRRKRKDNVKADLLAALEERKQ